MSNKEISFQYTGMNQDTNKSRHPRDFYYSGNNLRVLATDENTTGAVINEKGNTLFLSIPTVTIDTTENTISWDGDYAGSIDYYQLNQNTIPEIEQQINAGIMPVSSSNQEIIGHAVTRDSIILITTDSRLLSSTTSQMDCMWEIGDILEDESTLTLLYCRNLELSTDYPIQALFNYENDIIQKIYWVDGNKQTRFINIKHSIENGDIEELIDVNSNTINIVGNFDLTQPEITGYSTGGTHTAGMIQYGYNLYRLNAAQTKLSPLTPLYSLDKGETLGGGDLNEIVGMIPIVVISDIDPEYTHINVYAIKYTSLNESPSVDVIYHEELNTETTVTIYDDGSTIESSTLEEILFLGSDPIIPKHIESKENILFSSNLKEIAFDIDLDCRAYSFLSNGTGSVWDNVVPNAGGTWVIGNEESFTPGNYSAVGPKSDAVNLLYDTQKYQSDGTTLGGEGTYLKYTLVRNYYDDLDEIKEYSLFKDNEIYRIGIQFYNKLGQTSFPKWIGDFKSPMINLIGGYYSLRIDLTSEFSNWLLTNEFESDDDKPIGYRVIRADRQIGDRSIVAQGLMTGMMARTTDDPTNTDFWGVKQNRRSESDDLIKFPQPISRTFNDDFSPFLATEHLRQMQFSGGQSSYHPTEIWEASPEGNKRQHAWQYTKMMQMHNPEAMFNSGISLTPGMTLSIVGLAENTKNDYWYKRIQVDTLQDVLDVKYEDVDDMLDDADVYWNGIFGPTNQDNIADQLQVNREYHNFIRSTSTVERDIYGSPELTERGQSTTSYNNDPTFKYSNSMAQLASDEGNDNEEEQRAIITMNSYGSKCITIVEGGDTTEIYSRKGLEDLYALTGISSDNGALIGEIRIPDINIYIGNLYGGNSYESKQRNTYLEIGSYKTISDLTSIITSPGDTFVYNYKIERIGQTDTEILDDQTLTHTNIISFPCESTIDMKNRSDLSIFDWDAEFQPAYDDYQVYNTVYSQQPSLVSTASEDFTFKRVKNFDSRVIATSTKVPGEDIDSWTNFLINETLDVDGKYGPITGMLNFKDEIFTFQDSGVAKLSIQPRVQVQADDGLGIELGIGAVLYHHNYLSTTSGSINKWGITASPYGFYYYDGLNRTFNKSTGQGIEIISAAKGLHSFFQGAVNYSDIKVDNPLLSKGVVVKYDPTNHDVFLTVHQTTDSFTLSFNEKSGTFTSFYDYIPTMYISKGFKLLALNSDRTGVWEQYTGDYNTFFDDTFETKITLVVNPAEKDSIFNNLNWKSEVYNPNDTSEDSSTNPVETDIYNETLNYFRAYNEYQDTTEKELILNSNLTRKFRQWNATIPRNTGTLDRMRGNWIYLDLVFRPNDNRRLVLYDIRVNYTANQ